MKILKRKWFPLILVFLIFFTLSSCNEECPPCETPVDAPEEIISVNDAKLMYDTYGIRRKPLIERYEDSINRRKDYGRNDKMKQQNKKNANGNSAVQGAVAVDSFPVARYVYYDIRPLKII